MVLKGHMAENCKIKTIFGSPNFKRLLSFEFGPEPQKVGNFVSFAHNSKKYHNFIPSFG